MPSSRLPSPARRFASPLLIALSLSLAPLSAADSALNDLVNTFTE